MDNAKRIEKLKDKEYQELFGVKKATFEKMLEILNEQYKKEHEKGGKPPKLGVLDKLIIMLCYYREYRTMQNITFDYEVTKGTICNYTLGRRYACKKRCFSSSVEKKNCIPIPK